MLKYLVLFVVLVITSISPSSSQLHAQTVVVEPSIIKLMEMYVNKNREKNYVEGWRIQLLATTDRRAMESTKRKFNRTFPNIRSFWLHKEPYYYLRVGAFGTKLEALPELQRIKRKFPRSYIVVDKVKYSELISK